MKTVCPPSPSEKSAYDLEYGVHWVSADEQNSVLLDACPICGHDSARPKFAISRTPFRIVDCLSCGVGRLHPRPDGKTISQFYPPSYYGVTGAKFTRTVEALVRFVGGRQVRALSRGLRRGARVLDIGCGRGVLLSAFADRGFDVHGFEISAAAAAGADPRASIRVAGRLEEAVYPDAYFDEVILWHVLEHLPDPPGTLHEIRRILRPGGRLDVAVPNYSSFQAHWAGPAWFHLDPPRHLFHFPLAGLQRLLVDTGFACLREHHFSLRQNPFGWVQSGLNRFERLPRNGLYVLLKSQGHSSSSPTLAERAVFRFAYVCGMPIACGLSVIETLFRSGASVHVVAQARDEARVDRGSGGSNATS